MSNVDHGGEMIMVWYRKETNLPTKCAKNSILPSTSPLTKHQTKSRRHVREYSGTKPKVHSSAMLAFLCCLFERLCILYALHLFQWRKRFLAVESLKQTLVEFVMLLTRTMNIYSMVMMIMCCWGVLFSIFLVRKNSTC